MTINPFDPKTVFLAKHAQHVVLVHFPVALFLAGVLFDFLGQRTKNSALATAAYFNFLCAALATIPTIATGLLAWQWALDGQRPTGILLMHLMLGCLSSFLIWTVWLIHRAGRRKPGVPLPGYRLAIESLAVAAVAIAAHLGGFLSGVNGGS